MGLNGYDAEFAKNIILAGVKSITFLNHRPANEWILRERFIIFRMPTTVILIRDSKMDLLDKYDIHGNLESITAVINENDLKLDSEWNDYNLLKKALTYKHKDITKFIIAKNFRVNKFSIRDEDTTPLHIAVELEWEDIVLLLLEKGASVEVRDNTSKLTPIQLSFFMKKNRCQYIGTLLPPNEFIDPTCIVYSSNLKYVDSLYIFFNNL